MEQVKRLRVYMGKGGVCGAREIRRLPIGATVGMKKMPQVYYGGGVRARTVLASGGIANGGIVRVSSAERSALSEVKMVGRRPIEVKPSGMSENEKAAADFFEWVEADKAMAAGAKAEAEEKGDKVAELSELPLGETVTSVTAGGGKRKKRRKGRRSQNVGEETAGGEV